MQNGNKAVPAGTADGSDSPPPPKAPCMRAHVVTVHTVPVRARLGPLSAAVAQRYAVAAALLRCGHPFATTTTAARVYLGARARIKQRTHDEPKTKPFAAAADDGRHAREPAERRRLKKGPASVAPRKRISGGRAADTRDDRREHARSRLRSLRSR